MARDAARVSEKFVSEFCGFRESAHLWCLRNPGAYLDASRAVPAWARNQLRATDPAPDVEALARGASGDAYWDDCQKCLVLSGEPAGWAAAPRVSAVTYHGEATLSSLDCISLAQQDLPRRLPNHKPHAT